MTDAEREYNAYIALELARDGTMGLDTIFKSTGGYRQEVVDLRGRLPRAPLPRQTGGPHKDKRRPARINMKASLRKGDN